MFLPHLVFLQYFFFVDSLFQGGCPVEGLLGCLVVFLGGCLGGSGIGFDAGLRGY